MITLSWLLLIALAGGVLALVDGIWRLRARGGSTVVGIIEIIVAGLFPVLIAIAALYVRTASRNESRYRSLADDT